MSVKKRVAIIGAGWAGMAAAVELVDRGFHVEVFEASRTLGGRARSLEWNGLTIDNGQHILVGAYTETLRLMRKVGVDPDKALMRIPLTLHYPGEFKMVAPHLPAPFHTALALLTAQGLDWHEKFAAIRLMLKLKRDNYRIEPDITVTQWLDNNKVPTRQRIFLWDSLCISALNTPADRASAQVMANVLRDSLGGPRAASDMLVPRLDLSSLFPDSAAQYVIARGGKVHCNRRIEKIRRQTDSAYIEGAGDFNTVILAVAPYHAADLLDDTIATQLTALKNFRYEPIVTTFVQLEETARLQQPMSGIANGMSQWVFDRGHFCGQHGLMAAVISARGRHLDIDRKAMESHVIREVADLVKPQAVMSNRAVSVIEKRATFSCTPGLPRPATDCLLDSTLLLAGDYVQSDYPGTIEGAVRSGVSAANQVSNR